MAPLHPIEFEPQGLHQALGVPEPDVCQLAVRQAVKERPGVHQAPPESSSLVTRPALTPMILAMTAS
jgi:hypothetical protein